MSSGESFSVSGLRTAGIKGREAVIWVGFGEKRGRSPSGQEPLARPLRGPLPLFPYWRKLSRKGELWRSKPNGRRS